MQKIYTILILSLCYCTTWAQYSLQGTIIHQNDSTAVVGATIYIPQLQIGATTDANGKYRINRLPKGYYTIQISSVSYKTILAKADIQSDQNINFVMESTSQTLEEVIVTGSSTKTIIKESPIPIVAIGQAKLLQQSSTNLVDAVAKLPGMSQVSTGIGLSKPIIRGLGFNRVITMHDGVRQEDNQWGEEHSIQIDEYSIDRYEIIRGAGSLMYGSDGLGGVVSMLSPRPVEEGKITGRILTNYQTNHRLIGTSVQISGNKNGVTWHLHTSTKSSQNYRNRYDGIVYASNFSEPFNINGSIGLSKKWGYSRIYFLRSFQKFNIINGTRDSNGHFTTATILPDDSTGTRTVTQEELKSRSFIPYNSQELINSKIAWSSLFNLNDKASLSATISYAQNRRNEYGDVTRPWQSQLSLYLHTYYYDIRYNLAPTTLWEVNVGSNGMYQQLDNHGFQVLYPNYNLFDNGLFIFGKRNFEKLKISGGIRYDSRTLTIGKLYIDSTGNFQVTPQGVNSERFSGLEKRYQNISASLGGVYTINDQLLIRTNISRGFRAPTVPELSSNGVHAGTFRYEIGNLKAIPEVAYQGDIGFTYENKNLYVDVNFFQNSIRNYTFSERVQTQNGTDSLVQGSIPVFRYTQGNARLRGIEATATFNPQSARWFSVTQNYSSVFGENLSASSEDGKNLPFMPAPRWITQLKVSKDRWHSYFQNLYATIDFELYQAQNNYLKAYNTETRTPGYQIVNIGIGGDLTTKRRQTLCSVYLSVNNVFDIAYQSHQSRLKYLDKNMATGRTGVYNMGRNISFKVVIPFTSN
ncbi:TonB-dependent receptor [Cytophagaceae bacterium YF14B1]|uniref:TonB-dependent receptor n=1 Tax=Xanthocytophaga flava TaxID=3048013 RepID=A0AAE3QQK9_9BACT|nr:TonB-dependent receptor [Xanthocytophaga flavus]MDJ1483672.1 TonB-dependent receptor [Xanthocytophaga flavus]